MGLKTHTNKVPRLISDQTILPGVFSLHLRAPGFSKQSFQNVQGNLQTQLGMFVDEINENIENRSIEIIYAKKELKFPYRIPDIHAIPPGTFVIGKSRAKQVTSDLMSVPHLLIGGETDGGKSTFQRQFATTLYLNNPQYQFLLIDLKEGLEFQLFESLPRVTVVTDVAKAITEIGKLPLELKRRMEIIRAASCVDLPGYLEKCKEKAEFNRLVIIVDEAAELFLSGPGKTGEGAQLARRAVAQVARQGRAVGIHLLLATQRPEVKVIDGQIKANLTGVLAYPTPNNETSMTVLGNTKATQLPKIKGRALWKVGSQMTEVQTPLLEPDEVRALLKGKPKEKSKDAVAPEIKEAPQTPKVDRDKSLAGQLSEGCRERQ